MGNTATNTTPTMQYRFAHVTKANGAVAKIQLNLNSAGYGRVERDALVVSLYDVTNAGDLGFWHTLFAQMGGERVEA